MPGSPHDLGESARSYAYATPVDMTNELRTLRGESTIASSPTPCTRRPTSQSSLAPLGIRRLGRQTTAHDFRAVSKIMLGAKIRQHAAGASERRLGTFADLAQRMGQGAVETEDGSSSPCPRPTAATARPCCSARRCSMPITATRQAAFSDATPSAPCERRRPRDPREAEQSPGSARAGDSRGEVAPTIVPATAADVNSFSDAMSLVVEPRLRSATRWYVTAGPSEIDGREFPYLGQRRAQVESRSEWDVDGVEIREILDFGARFIEHRGRFQPPGA